MPFFKRQSCSKCIFTFTGLEQGERTESRAFLPACNTARPAVTLATIRGPLAVSN